MTSKVPTHGRATKRKFRTGTDIKYYNADITIFVTIKEGKLVVQILGYCHILEYVSIKLLSLAIDMGCFLNRILLTSLIF